ncbi:MAG: hypothetical protein ACK52I_01655 [Pseudomonadota bacterium]|jgi:hypothetical protein
MANDEQMRRAVDRARERMMTKPDPRTGKPLTGDQADRRAAELARAHEQGRKAKDLDTKGE